MRDHAQTPKPEKTTAVMNKVVKPSCSSPAAYELKKNPAQTDVIRPADAVRLRCRATKRPRISSGTRSVSQDWRAGETRDMAAFDRAMQPMSASTWYPSKKRKGMKAMGSQSDELMALADRHSVLRLGRRSISSGEKA